MEISSNCWTVVGIGLSISKNSRSIQMGHENHNIADEIRNEKYVKS